MVDSCVFCTEDGGEVVWRDDFARVIVAGDADHPGLCRVVLVRHVREMTDLSAQQRSRLMNIVFAVEAAQRALLQPDKVNLASLGNQVPHLHWHVIPRFSDDPHFPNPSFGLRRNGRVHPLPGGFAQDLARELARRIPGD